MPKGKRIRVRHIGPGHHSNIWDYAFNPEAHVLLKSPTHDKSGREIPPKYKTTKGGSSAAAEPPLGETPAAKQDEEPQE
jgi:hypothetical protein